MKNISWSRIINGSMLMHALLAVATIAITLTAWGVGRQVQAALLGAGERSRAASVLLAQSERLHAEWKSVQADHDAVNREIADLRAKLPEKAEEASFLQQISALAAEHQVALSEYRPGTSHKCDDHHEMELRLRCSGEYSNLCRWLARIQQLPRMSRVSQLTVTAPRTADGDCRLDCQINLLFGLVEKKETVQP